MKTVIRVLEIQGEDAWVNDTLEHSLVSTDKPFECNSGKIREILRDEVVSDCNCQTCAHLVSVFSRIQPVEVNRWTPSWIGTLSNEEYDKLRMGGFDNDI